MAYNLISYNHAAYNINIGVIFIEAAGIEEITVAAVPSHSVTINCFANEKVEGDANGEPSRMIEGTGLETISAGDIKAEIVISIPQAQETISGEAVIAETVLPLNTDTAETISGSAYGDLHYWLAENLSEEISASASGISMIFLTVSAQETIDGTAVEPLMLLSVPAINETVAGESGIEEIVYILKTPVEENIDSQVAADPHFWIIGSAEETISAESGISKIAFPDAQYTETIDGSAVDPLMLLSVTVIGNQMQYNLIQYNAGVYNTSGNGVIREIVTGESETIEIVWILETSAEENVDSEAAADPHFWISGTAEETINADANGTRLICPTAKYNEVVDGIVESWIMYLSVPPISETVSEDAVIEETVCIIPAVGEEIVSGAADINETVFLLEYVASETIESLVSGATIVFPTALGMELISTAASIVSIEESVCTIEITLEPGHMLVIDADTYTVYLDGVPVVWTHSGDWIDKLTRDTLSLDVVAAKGSSALETSIIYTERYL